MNWQKKDMWQFVERFHVPTGKQNFMDALREQYEGDFLDVSLQRQNTGNLVCELPLY